MREKTSLFVFFIELKHPCKIKLSQKYFSIKYVQYYSLIQLEKYWLIQYLHSFFIYLFYFIHMFMN